MLDLSIPGKGKVIIKKIVLDLNGTLTTDGELAPETITILSEVSKILQVYILTADTLGSAAGLKHDLKINIQVLEGANIGAAKAEIVDNLGPETLIAVGNGNNDADMLKKAVVGIAVLGTEGCSVKALQNADLLVKSIDDALTMILKPQRLIAGLRF